jgi:hypothetical protein
MCREFRCDGKSKKITKFGRNENKAFLGIFNFSPLLCLAQTQLPSLYMFLHFCHCINENFTYLDILHTWVAESPIQHCSGMRKDFYALSLIPVSMAIFSCVSHGHWRSHRPATRAAGRAPRQNAKEIFFIFI